MLLKRLLLKIETGQILTERQQKSLAHKLYLERPLSRSLIYTVMGVLIFILLIIGFLGGQPPVEAWIAFLSAGVLVLWLIYLLIFPKHFNLKKYLTSVEKFYEMKFKDYENFELVYIGQHINPHIKALRTSKIYLLSDGYHFLFVSDYFKDTHFVLPKYLTKGNISHLRVLNDKITDNYKMMVRLPDVEHFYVVEQQKEEDSNIKFCDYPHYKFFLDQNPKMDRSFVVLKMKGGIIFRLSYEVYEFFLKWMPLKELKQS